MKEQIEPAFKIPMEEGRLLIVTPFGADIKRVSSKTAQIRNKMMVELADKITVGYASKSGQLEELLSTTKKTTQYITS